MPRMNNPGASQILAKLLLIGDGKLGKSFYAALCAKAGFNVLYLDGDVGAQTIASMGQPGPDGKIALTAEELSRIYLLDIGDTISGGIRDSKMVEFMNEFIGNSVIRWNDTEQRIAKRSDTNCEIWEIKPAKMDHTVVLVMDSWTAYAESVMLFCGRANGVNIADASTHEMRPVYQGGGLKSNEMLQTIRSMPCHVIAIGHPDEYQHKTAPEGKKVGQIKENDLIVDWTKMIPKTTSKPQGLVMSKYFTDVAWMELSPSGSERRLNFKPKNDRVSGGHFFDVKSVEEYSFANLVKQMGGEVPGPGGAPTDHWLTIIQAGESQTAEPAKILDGTKAAPVKGMASMFGKA